jgi:PRTRC genetic system ThiF family protein
MSYIFQPSTRSGRPAAQAATIVLVGCGGTGGFVAESLCRLLLGQQASLYLVDPDRVEAVNVARQAFDLADVGRFKAQVLADRLSARFHREVCYSTLPFDARVHAAAFDRASGLNLVIGAVDNAVARRAIAETLGAADSRNPWDDERPTVVWLDAGNGHNSGQVLLGNALRPDELRRSFDRDFGFCYALPAPSLQRPDLLDAPPERVELSDPTCAEAVDRGDQSRTINQLMAAVIASYVESLLDGSCSWMATYLDMDNGTLRSVPIDPRHVAPIVGLKPAFLLSRSRSSAAA